MILYVHVYLFVLLTRYPKKSTYREWEREGGVVPVFFFLPCIEEFLRIFMKCGEITYVINRFASVASNKTPSS